MPDEIDVDKLEPVSGEADEEAPRLVLGLDFAEVVVLCNGVSSACLAFMALFGRNKAYGGETFASACLNEYQSFSEDGSFSLARDLPSFLLFVLERFYNEAIKTNGGSLVFDSTMTLWAGVALAIQLDMSRRQVVEVYSTRGALMAALLPLAAHILGPGTVGSFALFWLWKTKREARLPSVRTDGLPVHDTDIKRVACFVLACMVHLTLMFVILRSGSRDYNQSHPPHVHLFQVILFWLMPSIFALLSLFVPLAPQAYARQVRRLTGTLSLASFLMVGAAGFAVHSHGFGQMENIVKTGGGQAVVDSIVKDSLTLAPSRFLFVQFFHLMLVAIFFVLRQTDGSGGMGLVIFVTSLVGPAGAFGLIAAHHQFSLMREDGII